MEGLLDRLAALEDRHRELSLRVIDPEIIADPEAYRMAMRDYSELDLSLIHISEPTRPY